MPLFPTAFDASQFTIGVLVAARGGTGVANTGTLTVPATGTAALLEVANTFTLGTNQFRAGADGTVALAARRHSSGATANIFEARNESDGILLNITSTGAIGIRAALSGASALYAPWSSGDASRTAYFGSASGSNNQIAVVAESGSTTAFTGTSTSGIGIIGSSGSNIGLQAATGATATPAFEAFLTAVSATTSTTPAARVRMRSSGTPGNGFGAQWIWQLESTTTNDREAARWDVLWADATDASRKGRVALNAGDTSAEREGLRVESSGSAAMIGFLGATAAVRQTSGADLTNNVTSGGTDDTIANFTDLTTYATDAATIRNDIYQLARKLKQVNDALRLYGLLT